MSLLLIKKQYVIQALKAGGLIPGNWFIDRNDQICSIAIDERTNERRIICHSDFSRPFIRKVNIQEVCVQDILQPGSIFQIGSFLDEKEHTS